MSDFAHRINPRAVNKRVLESMAAAGAFDASNPIARAPLPRSTRCSRPRSAAMRRSSVGQSELFGGAVAARQPVDSGDDAVAAGRTAAKEFDAVGFFLTGHPLDDYAPLLKGLRVQSWAEFSKAVKAGRDAPAASRPPSISRTERRTKTGNKMGIFGLSDPSGQYEAIVFAEGLQEYRDMLEPGNAVLLFLIGGGAGRRRPRAHPDRRAAR